MILDKPVVAINLCAQLEETPYESSGVALGVRKPEDIVPMIKEALYSEQVRQELAEARKRFVYEYAYMQDGKAFKRVAELIRQMVEESRKTLELVTLVPPMDVN
jgi:hypothetical protein